MSAIVWVLGTFMILFLIAAIIISIVTSTKGKGEEVQPNAIILRNKVKKNLSGGHDDLLVLKHRLNKNGTRWINALPRDVYQGDNVKPEPAISFVVLDDDIIKHARGEASDHREEWEIVSKDLTDYPKKMQDTLEARYGTSEGIKSYVNKVFKTTVKEMDLGISEGIRDIAGGQLTDLALKKYKEDMELKAKAMALNSDKNENPK